MINQSWDVFIVELSPDNYYLQGSPNPERIYSTGDATQATRVQPGSPAYTLTYFSKEAFPNVRLVPLRITAVEIQSQITPKAPQETDAIFRTTTTRNKPS